MFSLFGWTPFLRCTLRSRLLPCGCVVGVYETRSGEVIEIVDARGADCPYSTHDIDVVLPAGSGLPDPFDGRGAVGPSHRPGR